MKKVILLASLIAIFLSACATKETDVYGDLFKDDGSHIPVNTKELKEIK